MKLFFDTEFTGLTKDTTLISLGIIAEDGRCFYAEFNDFNADQINDWILQNVFISLRKINHEDFTTMHYIEQSEFETFVVGNKEQVAEVLRGWLEALGEPVEMWSDCLAYDWVLFCDLFGGALHIPNYIYYIPFDLCTLLKIKNIDPDIGRGEIAGYTGPAHNALTDARAIRDCYQKLILL